MSVRIEQPLIYLITKGEATDSNFARTCAEILDIIRVAVAENVTFVQIREKALSARMLFELTSAATAFTSGSMTRLLVNDRADIAIAAKADGVHLTANSLPAAVIRKSFPPRFIIGVSTHSLEAVVDAAKQGADFAVFAPVFTTPGKGEPRGTNTLHYVCESVRPFPVIALGGIDESNCDQVLDAGANGIAAIRSFNDPRILRSIIGKLRR